MPRNFQTGSYGEIMVPSAVLQELGHGSAPGVIAAWAKSPPAWLQVRNPRFIPDGFAHLDFGEQQALALAKEIHAELVLLDDKVARRFAEQVSLKVKGTIGVVVDAARLGLLDFRETVEQLQQTTMHLDAKLAQRIIAAYAREMEKEGG